MNKHIETACMVVIAVAVAAIFVMQLWRGDPKAVHSESICISYNQKELPQ